MKTLHSEIEIRSSPKRVWSVLTDFDSYPEWNPFIRRLDGELKVGSKLEAFIQPSGARGMGFSPVVLRAEPNQELRWLGRLGVPHIFDGEHSFEIEKLGRNKVRFTQRENFSGLLVPFMSGFLDNDTRRGFEEMNQALKERVEKR